LSAWISRAQTGVATAVSAGPTSRPSAGPPVPSTTTPVPATKQLYAAAGRSQRMAFFATWRTASGVERPPCPGGAAVARPIRSSRALVSLSDSVPAEPAGPS